MKPKPFPLVWPRGVERTRRRKRSQFQVSFVVARDHLINELRLFRAIHSVLSSNLTLRRDGLPYANQREPDDPGVALYFHVLGQDWALACDQFDRVKDNVRALGKTVEAMRGLDRWGCTQLLAQMAQSFKALPPGREESKLPFAWWVALGCGSGSSLKEAERCYRVRAKLYHPDGVEPNPDMFKALQSAIEEARRVLKK